MKNEDIVNQDYNQGVLVYNKNDDENHNNNYDVIIVNNNLIDNIKAMIIWIFKMA